MFSNRNINWIHTHFGLWLFGNKIISAFGSIYLLKAGYSFANVAAIWGVSSIFRMLFRPFSVALVHKEGLKKSLILGSIISIGLFPALYFSTRGGLWIWGLILYMGIYDVYYWLPFHSLYAIAGNLDKMGKQTAFREVVSLLFSTIAPIAGSFLAVFYGFGSLYFLGAAVTLFSAWPLWHLRGLGDNEVMPFRKAIKTIDRRGFYLALGDGIFRGVDEFLWVIYLYFLAADLINYGWMVALQVFLCSILALVLGSLVDRGKGKKLFLVGAIGVAVVFLFRSFSVHTVTDVVISQILFALLSVFYYGPSGAVIYQMAKQTKSTLWFTFFSEGGYDVGFGLIYFLSAILVPMGFTLPQLFPLGIIGIVIVKLVLDSYYRHPHAAK